MRTGLLVALLALARAGDAWAGDPDPEPEPDPDQRASADVATAPLPGAESGRVADVDEGDGALRILGRGLLYIPRIPYELVMQPVRGALYVQDRYHAAERLTGFFYTSDRKIGVFPTALVETGFGLNVGVRAVWKDIFGADEKLGLRVGFGGEFRNFATARVTTGDRLGPVELSVEARYEKRDRERFSGYGNGDEVDMTAAPIDPLTDDTAVLSRFRMAVKRITPEISIRPHEDVEIAISGAFAHKDFSTGSSTRDIALEDAYAIDRVPGFRDDTRFVYSELALEWDTRRAADEYDPKSIWGTGGSIMAFAGRQQALDDGVSFYRAGLDLQRIIPITHGPRAITLRAYGETVTGPRDQIPFTELPRLGGKDALRGYSPDRFRDRTALLGQVSYVWALGRFLAGSLFADVGRVYEGLDAVSVEGLRVGYGIGLQGYGPSGVAARIELASSIDGGLFFYLALNPADRVRSRGERF